jgi:uncharacterized membrane-anchored protein
MPSPRVQLLAVVVLVVSPVGVPAQTPSPAPAPLTAEQRTAEIRKMNWLEGKQPLTRSKSTLALPDGFGMVRDAEARRMDMLINGVGDDELEAIVSGNKGTVYFSYVDAGYVTDDDWSNVDASGMIDDIKSGTEEANAERESQGLGRMHVTGWLQQPVFDKPTKTVHWAIEGTADDGAWVNAIALKLGRYGYERITWATAPEDYRPTGGTTDVMLAAQNFDSGARYEDHVSADKLAGYGIGALVATVAGVKIAQVLGFGAILLFAKKFIVLIIAGVAAAFGAVRRFFGGSRKQS